MQRGALAEIPQPALDRFADRPENQDCALGARVATWIMTRGGVVTSRERAVGQAIKSQTSANFVQTCNSVPGSLHIARSARVFGFGGLASFSIATDS